MMEGTHHQTQCGLGVAGYTFGRFHSPEMQKTLSYWRGILIQYSAVIQGKKRIPRQRIFFEQMTVT
jgi:hypothetical protein